MPPDQQPCTRASEGTVQLTMPPFRGKDLPSTPSETPKRTATEVITAELPKARQRAAANIAKDLSVYVSEEMVRTIRKAVDATGPATVYKRQ